MKLPIDAVRDDFLDAHAQGPVVLTSPTGSGKSTVVPGWCTADGAVLVVEPRRVACRSLAERVASLRGCRLGGEVGYQVRDESRRSEGTQILFATPGIVLRQLSELDGFGTVILDEFHERRLDTDLLLALLQRRHAGQLVVMSATVEGERLAEHLGARLVQASGRTYPVDVAHIEGDVVLPSREGLEGRVLAALERVTDKPGDVLVFLPGKAEIAALEQALEGRDLEVVALHGDLALKEQGRAFGPAARRKVILSTNVAETSVTVPGVSVVIDSGLVRRTRYHQGRGFLTLSPVALDSAEQRAGRAGRTGPGHCYRLWSERARLDQRTPPEVHRESLVPLLLGAAVCGERVQRLSLFDPPKEFALQAAEQELQALGALDDQGGLTECGRELFGLPLDAHLGRLLVEARGSAVAGDVVDLVASLAVGRPLFVAKPIDEDLDLRAGGCDGVALVRALREGRPREHGLSAFALGEARRNAQRLRRALGLKERAGSASCDRDGLIDLVLRADPRGAHVARTRGRRVAWSNGGTEIDLGRESALQRLMDPPPGGEPAPLAMLVLDTRALGGGGKGAKAAGRVIATAAMPVSATQLIRAGLGRERVVETRLRAGRLYSVVERVYAGKVLRRDERVPEGELAREAITTLVMRGSLFKGLSLRSAANHASHALAARLSVSRHGKQIGLETLPEPPELQKWTLDRLRTLGVESVEDLDLLSADDLLHPPLSAELAHVIDAEFPRQVSVGDALYAVDYDLAEGQVILRMVKGKRSQPPPAEYLPRFTGFRVYVEAGRRLHEVRRR